MFLVKLIGVLALIALNGFFAAAEFSLVTVRHSRIRQLIAAGDARAKVVDVLLADLHRVVSGVQLGITLTSLAIGALGEATFAKAFEAMLADARGGYPVMIVHGAALTCAFILLSALHVVLGELVPKTVSLARAERAALIIAPPFYWFLNSFRWAIYLLDNASTVIIKALGVKSPQGHSVAHSTEELQIQIQQARERGLLAPAEEQFIVGAMELGQVQVREIMVPRPDMHTLPEESTLNEVMHAFATTHRSRIPVYRGKEEHILGFVHIKDVLWIALESERRLKENLPPAGFDLRAVLREVLIVPETKPASSLLLEFRGRHVGLAVVVDEFGSILGLVTLEDILEQMVGEIHDEFDIIERPQTLADGAVVFDAALNVRDLDTQYGIRLPEDSAYATVGGFVLDQLGFIPKGGESFIYSKFRFSIEAMDGKRVARVKVEPLRSAAEASKLKETPVSVGQQAKDRGRGSSRN
ncbi:MAG: hemolysin family protein [Candidatus Acidiferrum sp.]